MTKIERRTFGVAVALLLAFLAVAWYLAGPRPRGGGPAAGRAPGDAEAAAGAAAARGETASGERAGGVRAAPAPVAPAGPRAEAAARSETRPGGDIRTSGPEGATLTAAASGRQRRPGARPGFFARPPGVDPGDEHAPPPPDAATVYGTVKGPEGVADAGATVSVIRGLDMRGGAGGVRMRFVAAAGGEGASAETGPDGSYRVTGIAPGPAMVVVRSARFADPEPRNLDLKPNEECRVDFECEAGGSIAGHVRDGTGRALGGIEVSSLWPERTATTASDGGYRLEGLGPDMPAVMLAASDPSNRYAQAMRQGRIGDEAADFTLEAAARIEVTVLAEGSGAVLEGATVVDVTPQGGGGFVLIRDPGAGGAVTDAGGRAVLEGVPPGAGRKIRAEKDGYAPAEVRLDVAAGATHAIEIELGPGATIRGIVRDPSGRPLPGALVLGDGGRSGDSMGPERMVDMISSNFGAEGTTQAAEAPFPKMAGAVSTFTGQDGRFELANIMPGKRSVAAGHRDYVGAAVTVLVEHGEEAAVEIVLGAGGAVEGRAFAGDGQPAAGCRVHLFSMRGGAKTALVAEDGSYRIRGLRAGTYMATLQPEAGGELVFGPGAGGKTVEVEEGRTARLDFGTGREGAAIAGTIRRGGRPYQGRVALLAAGGGLAGFRETTADPGGAYRFEGVPPGEYDLAVDPTYRRRVHVAADAREIALDLDLPSLSIAGRVLDPAGRAVAGARVRAQRAEEVSGAFSGWMAVEVTSDPSGAFLAEGLDDASYSVEALKEGYSPVRATVASSAALPVTLTLGPGARIKARVLTPEGDPVLGVLQLTATNEETGETRTSRTTMDGLGPGEVAIDGLPAGTYALAAVAFGGGFDRRTGVRFDGRSELTLDMVIGPGGTLALTARDPGGRPVALASVAIAFPDGQPIPASVADAMQPLKTSSLGIARRERLPPGDYRGTVTAPDGRPAGFAFRIREEEETAVAVTVP